MRPFVCRASFPLLLAISLLTVLEPRAAQSQSSAQPIDWVRSDASCGVREPVGGYSFGCGAFGEFTVGTTRAPGCSTLASGTETPRALSPEVDADVGSTAGRAPNAYVPYERFGTFVAVDWASTGHAFWVLKTFVGASDSYIASILSPFDHAQTGTELGLPYATDLAFLEMTCGILTTFPSDFPEVLNFSFGRVLEEPPCASGDSIPCEISRLFAYLKQEHGTLIVASAGNHGELLFPASDPNVLSVGMLDTQRFYGQNTVAGTANTPADVDALIPGHGLVIDDHPDSADPKTWSIPAGSSFSTALLAGWLAYWEEQSPGALDVLVRGEYERPLSIEVAPDGYRLATASVGYLDTSYDFIDRILDLSLGTVALEDEVPPDTTLSLSLSGTPIALALPPSRPQVNQDTNLPTPGSAPCVPCRLRRNGRRASGEGPEQWTLRMDSEGIEETGRLDALYLRVDDTYWSFEGADLSAWVAGMSTGLDIELQLTTPANLLGRSTPLLVQLVTRLKDNVQFWDATPLGLVDGPPAHDFGSDFEGTSPADWSTATGRAGR